MGGQKQIFYIFLIASSFSAMTLSSETSSCPLYTCKLKDQLFEKNTCVFYTPTVTQPTYYVSTCTSVKTPYCQAPAQTNSTCEQSPPSPSVNAWPGEKCTLASDCSNHAKHGCVNSICVGSLSGENCFTNDDCNPGLRCFNQQCVDQIHVGGTGCTSDYDCVNGAGCNLGTFPADSICFPYFSINPHLPVGSCSSLNTSMLCNSGLCMEYEGVYECMNTLSSSKKIPTQCTVDSDCVSTRDDYFVNGQLEGHCYCGYNPTGTSYCSLFPGDTPVKDNNEYLLDWLRSSQIDSCNTMRRLGSQCMSD